MILRVPVLALSLSLVCSRAFAAQNVQVKPGTVQKVCQLTGDYDHQLKRNTPNQTGVRAKVKATDLGISTDHVDPKDGKLKTYIFFGDTHASPGVAIRRDEDFVAVSESTDPERDCLDLKIVSDNGAYRPIQIPDGEKGKPINPYEFNVPTGAFSANGKLYVFKSTDGYFEPDGAPVMGRTVLASSSDGGREYQHHHDVSRSKFINVAAKVVDNAAVPGLPDGTGKGVIQIASGKYRKSDAYLAYSPAQSVESAGARRYFAGTDPVTQKPKWSTRETDAVQLFDQPCIGELSVDYVPNLHKWVMLYNCDQKKDPPAGIHLRSADQPWGPWSEPVVAYNPFKDPGYCDFIKAPPGFSRPGRSAEDCAKNGGDPGNTNTGGPYGPYILSRHTRDLAPGVSEIYFVMSTWNPYQAVLMKATLESRPQ